jgi:hypothetical protein
MSVSKKTLDDMYNEFIIKVAEADNYNKEYYERNKEKMRKYQRKYLREIRMGIRKPKKRYQREENKIKIIQKSIVVRFD